MTASGESVRILSHNLRGTKPIVAVIDEGRSNLIFPFTKNGKYFLSEEESEYDIFFAPKKKVGWINIYRTEDGTYAYSRIYSSKKEAKDSVVGLCGVVKSDYLESIKIEWND